ncbi:alpha/beta hydrolase [Stappia sp. BW2]|uniref:alpha/beta fold hydrolase n=1 Tax=Stappia sp. BW2 TaxID=2592622 RepID=UPI0011DE82EF|nr:alpha/beta hydrolase [Stappia sp. BW2]TYC67980.1 alpha/beta hydrolase [Stappia sp. BW2]
MTSLLSGTVHVETQAVPVGSSTVHVRIWTPEDHLPGKAPVLLFHDSLGCIALWRDFPERLALASGRTVIAYDRPGFGQSSALSDTLPASFIADEGRTVVPVLCEQLGLSRFVACGHSVGGGMAAHTAAQHPDRVTALVTIAAQALIEHRTLEGVREARTAFADPDAFDRLTRYHGAKARWVLNAWTESWLSPAFADWSLDDALAGVRCNTLAIHGALDEYGSPRHPEHIARSTGGQKVVLPDTGHIPHRECPEVLVDTICGFLANAS